MIPGRLGVPARQRNAAHQSRSVGHAWPRHTNSGLPAAFNRRTVSFNLKLASSSAPVVQEKGVTSVCPGDKYVLDVSDIAAKTLAAA